MSDKLSLKQEAGIILLCLSCPGFMSGFICCLRADLLFKRVIVIRHELSLHKISEGVFERAMWKLG